MYVGEAGCGYRCEECVSGVGEVWRGLNWNSGFMANHKEGWESLCTQTMFLNQVPSPSPPGSLGYLLSSRTRFFFRVLKSALLWAGGSPNPSFSLSLAALASSCTSLDSEWQRAP